MKPALVIEPDTSTSASVIADSLVAGKRDKPAAPLPVQQITVPVDLHRSDSPNTKGSVGKLRSIYDPCWEVRVRFLCPATPETFAKLVRRFEPEFEDHLFSLGICHSSVAPDGIQVINIGFTEWVINSADYAGTLAHECFHATQYILEHRGVGLSDCTSETYAYLLDSLVRRGTCLLNKMLDKQRSCVAP